VMLGSSTLTNATSSPVFTITSPEPPMYYGHTNEVYQYKPDKDATISALISYSSTAGHVQAEVANVTTGAATWVEGVIGTTTVVGELPITGWAFNVPTNEIGYQDGNWQIKTLKIWDKVFSAAGVEYTENNPLVLDVADKNIKTKVVSQLYISIGTDVSQNFGLGTNGEPTSTFMTPHTVPTLSLEIKDFEGKAVSMENVVSITDVKFTFTHETANMVDYGGYTSSDGYLNGAQADEIITVTLSADSTGIHFVADATQANNQIFRYAGKYTTAISYKINGITYTLSGNALPKNAPQFTVWSMKPDVKFTATDPKVGVGFTGESVSGSSTEEVKNVISADGYTLDCYFEVTQSKDSCGAAICGGYDATKATTTASNLGTEFASATCTIKTNGTASDVVYTYTPTAQSNTQAIGSSSGTTKKPIGIGARATQLIVTYGSHTYMFELTNPLTVNGSR